MQVNAETIKGLADVLTHTLSPDKATRQAAEAHLQKVEHLSGFPLVVLKLVEMSETPMPLRQAGAILFKNFVKRCWDTQEDEVSKVSETDRTAIRAALVTIMCSVPITVQRIVSEALTAISRTDFPDKWPTLLPELVSKLNAPDMTIVNGVLETANSIFKRFRNADESKSNILALKAALDVFQEPLLAGFTAFTGMVTTQASNKDALVPLFAALRSMARIFYSLNWITIPEFFEDHQKEWMTMFQQFLTYKNPLLVDEDEEDISGPVELLQAAILDNITIYAQKYDDEFKEFFPPIVQAVWQLLVGWGDKGKLPKYDVIITAAMKFLANVAGQDMHSDMFGKPETLSGICTAVTIPNLTIRPADEELFEDNPADYIRRDIEGSDTDTRRRAAADLINALCRRHDEQVTAICMKAFQDMIAPYASNPAVHWKQKESAIALLIALSVRAETRAQGVVAVNTRVPLEESFAKFVMPELAAADINALPMLKSTCLKYLTTFRNQLSAASLVAALEPISRLLVSENLVIRTYAASALDKCLQVKTAAGPTIPPPELMRFVPTMIANVFNVLKAPGLTPNEYFMKAALRIVAVAGPAIAPMTGDILAGTCFLIDREAANPAHPAFNHCMFETVAALIRAVCSGEKTTERVDKFEAALFVHFQTILTKDVAEFLPYVFQLMAQMLAMRPPPSPGAEVVISDGYKAVFPTLLQQQVWQARGNVPALVMLMSTYMEKCPRQVAHESGRIAAILGVFQRLLGSRATEDQAFSLLSSFILHVPLADFSPLLPNLYRVLGERLQKNRTAKFLRLFVRILCLVSAKHGANAVSGPLDNLGAGTFMSLLEGQIVPNAPSIAGRQQRKNSVIGLVRFLCEVPGLLESKPDLWAKLLACTVTLIEETRSRAAAGSFVEESAVEEPTEYGAAFAKLQHAAQSSTDPFTEIIDTRILLARSLAGLSSSRAGVVPPLIEKAGTSSVDAVRRYCTEAGVTL